MHTLIVTGGTLDYTFAKEYCKTLSYDKVFAVDMGLEYVHNLAMIPDMIIGDFDTVDGSLLMEYEQQIAVGRLDTVLERYPAKKDATDTELALLKAIEMGTDEITLLAGTGSRLDHVLMNMNLLLQAEEAGIVCFMVDATNRIQLLSDHTRKNTVISKKKQHGRYLSIIPAAPIVTGLTIEGVAYPLNDGQICQGSSMTVSNYIVDDVAQISLNQGCVWVIESKDRP